MKPFEMMRAGYLVIPLLVAFAAPCFGQSFASGRVALSDIQPKAGEKSELEMWRGDLNWIKEELPKKHPALFHRLDKARFYAEIEKLDKALPKMTANRAAFEMARIVGLPRDGHTRISPLFWGNSGFRLFPYMMYEFSDGIYIRKASPEYKDIVGTKVLGIGKYSIEEAYKLVSPYMSTDNEMWFKEYVPIYLGCPELLEALGITDSPDSVTLKLEKEGKRFTKMISLSEGGDDLARTVLGRLKDWPDARDTAKGDPLYLRNRELAHWFEYLPEKKLLYVQMKDVLNAKDETLEQFWARVFAEADDKKPDKLVLDLRYNGGGDNTLVKPIIRGIIQHTGIDREGRLYVFIGRQTFSAAQNLTNMLEKWTNAVFVGEPTGSHVNMYGDSVGYELPNSKMPVRISSLFWQNMHARDERKWTAPQIVAELSFDDYVNNIDPALEAAGQPYERSKTLRDIALAAYKVKDFTGFREKAIAFKNDPKNKYADVESQINGFGYELMGVKMTDIALQMFQLNVELFPESSNVYDSLGEAYMNTGENELAIKNYKKSLELDPDNANAAEMIRRIESGGHPNH